MRGKVSYGPTGDLRTTLSERLSLNNSFGMDAAIIQPSIPANHDFLVEALLIKPDLTVVLDPKDIISVRNSVHEAARSNDEIDLTAMSQMAVQHFEREHGNAIIVEGLELREVGSCTFFQGQFWVEVRPEYTRTWLERL
ncbi:hypothetical protein JQ617_29650 [Bradyrhizobium sp. KB893862 SZCCT0404]|uniref:hypothetical protein n=1 Tax=Bradyrhizobium sp. KB893862 SZCCT0404 TaxID=2807672 RepID=UPI001BAD7F45|nr:hypothetical protein [Bradyrhizobium sp. KB893862 SZCCT0404]MBR1178159.1 hypothetical protein [Bradyrhizobium sp. KB893862 SZCCT0404]